MDPISHMYGEEGRGGEIYFVLRGRDAHQTFQGPPCFKTFIPATDLRRLSEGFLRGSVKGSLKGSLNGS